MTGHKGKCFCGAVEIEVEGNPEAMGYCHCSSCRSWSASPVNAFTLWQPQHVKVTKGAEHLGRFRKTDMRYAYILQVAAIQAVQGGSHLLAFASFLKRVPASPDEASDLPVRHGRLSQCC